LNRVQDYLRHIAEAIRRIEEYTAGMDRDGFMASVMTQDAVIRNIEIIGEAGRNIMKAIPILRPKIRI